jgi:hypothetical protein
MDSEANNMTAELILAELSHANFAAGLSKIINRVLWFAIVAFVLLVPNSESMTDFELLRYIIPFLVFVPVALIFTEESASSKLRRASFLANEIVPNLAFDSRNSEKFDEYVRQRHEVMSRRYSIYSPAFGMLERREWLIWASILMACLMWRFSFAELGLM